MPWSGETNLRGRVARHFGRRGSFLTLFGFLWIAIGEGVLTVPTRRFSRGEGHLLEFADDPRWGIGWMVCGLIAIGVGLMRRRLGNRDEWGFNALLIPPLAWSLTYMWSWISALVTDRFFGNINGWVGALVFGTAVLAILVVAGWPDASDENRRTCK